jgi:monoamine oxidase
MKKQTSKPFVILGTLIVTLIIWISGCGFSGGEVKPALPIEKTAIVIGAGISGLKAAVDLEAAGFDVTVLEAQSEVGGRLKTDRSLGVAFDEGASWIHGSNTIDHPITPLATEAGMNLFETVDENVAVFDTDGSEYTDVVLEEQYELYEQVLGIIDEEGDVITPVKSILDSIESPTFLNPRLRDYMFTAFLEFSTGGDINLLSSAQHSDDETFSGSEMLVTNGYDKLAKYLSSYLNVELNAVVDAINYSNEQVEVHTTDNRIFSARFVVVTVPLGVLQNEAIEFTPQLPSRKTEAIHRVKMGNVNKFLLVWDRTFWDNSLQYIGYTNSGNQVGRFNYFLNVNLFSPNTHALMTFAFGDQADNTESLSDDQIISEVVANLTTLYGDAVPTAKPTLLRTAWRQNEYSKGAYSFAGIGSDTSDFDILAESVEDKIYFAGEHTSRLYRGTVHGAYLSGEHAAKQIITLVDLY